METPSEEEVGVVGVEVWEATAVLGHFMKCCWGG